MSDFINLLNQNNPIQKISSFGLKNFRVFENYQNFQLRPFTILTGTNNNEYTPIPDGEKKIDFSHHIQYRGSKTTVST